MNLDSKVIPLALHPMGFIDGFTHFGADLDLLLKNTGVNANTLRDSKARISYRQQHQIVCNGLALCNKPGIGLLIGLRNDWCFHGSVGNVVGCAPSLIEAGNAFRRYITIAEPYYAMHVNKPMGYIDENNDLVNPLHFLLSIAEDETSRLFEIEYRLASSLRVWDLCGNKSVSDPSVHVQLDYDAPPHAELYQQLPCASLTFSAPQSHIKAKLDYVVEPHRAFHQVAFKNLIQQCEKELQQAKIEPSFSAMVKWHLLTRVHSDTPNLQDLTAVLGLSPRAIRRKLAAEDTNFRQLCNEVKMETSAHYLNCSDLSIDAIAQRMGFANTSSFRRALRNWDHSTQHPN